MKILKTTIPLLLFLCLPKAFGQDPIIVNRLKAIGERFEKLPLDERKEYYRLKQKANEAYNKKKFFSSMVAIDDALNIFPDDMDMIWLKGACHAQIQDVNVAISFYNEVLKINPNHIQTLMNLVEINFFDGRYKEAVDYIIYVNKLLDSRVGNSSALLNFKYLISLTKLKKENPEKYSAELERLYNLHSYMEDNPYYYYSKALKNFDSGNKEEAYFWILKAYMIFKNAEMTKIWNKALIDTGIMGAHEVMLHKVEKK